MLRPVPHDSLHRRSDGHQIMSPPTPPPSHAITVAETATFGRLRPSSEVLKRVRLGRVSEALGVSHLLLQTGSTKKGPVPQIDMNSTKKTPEGLI